MIWALAMPVQVPAITRAGSNKTVEVRWFGMDLSLDGGLVLNRTTLLLRGFFSYEIQKKRLNDTTPHRRTGWWFGLMFLSALSSLAAGPPRREDHFEVMSVDLAVVIEVGDVIRASPGVQEDREVATIDHTVTVEVGGAVVDRVAVVGPDGVGRVVVCDHGIQGSVSSRSPRATE